MKKITFLLFAALCLAFASTADAHDFEVGGIYYNITSYDEPYTVEVTYSGTSAGETAEYSGNVTIPATVTHSGYEITYSVTAVGASAFQGNTGLTSVTIPVGVTYLGVGAFVSCTALENVSLPEGLISMGN
ncbi:MAG: leucine-rich repeat domain-containing protein, partial [Bacteroidales bacterium]|nr:leucine-rich repeat domain-containing protein [Bacteroidales bacterium]